jgi:hypothetical protein
VRNCHETASFAEGREKIAKGMQVLIREGTAFALGFFCTERPCRAARLPLAPGAARFGSDW